MTRYLYILFTLLTYSAIGQINPFNIDGGSSDSLTVVEEVTQPDSAQTLVVPDVKDDNPFEIGIETTTKEKEIENEGPVVQEKEDKPIKTPPPSSDNNTFAFWIMLISLVLIAAAINIKRDFVPSLINSVTNNNVLKLNMRNHKGGLSLPYILLYVNLFLQLALIIYFIARHFWHYPQPYLILVVCVLGILLLRHLILWLTGTIYQIKDTTSEYSFNIITHYIIYGIFLIPINLFIAFAPSGLSTVLLYIGILMGVLLFLLSRLRGTILLLPRLNTNYFQIFMYLCTFEILPILVIAKFIGDNYTG